MTVAEWHYEYLSSLLDSDTENIVKFETVSFIRSLQHEHCNGVFELLLHRTIARTNTERELLDLLVSAASAGWVSYLPRVMAKLPDVEVVREKYPEYDSYIDYAHNQEVLHACYSIRDWRLITNDIDLIVDSNSPWSRHRVSIENLVNPEAIAPFTIDGALQILHFNFQRDVRLFQVAIACFSSQDLEWANVLQRLLAAPYINVRLVPARQRNDSVASAPDTHWAPKWVLCMDGLRHHNWKAYERCTYVSITGQEDKNIRDQITILLSVSGLLRDGNMLAPLNGNALASSKNHPIWGFASKQYAAGGTGYEAPDIRALALSYLEQLPSSTRVSIFRSRLAFYFLSLSWVWRKSASILSSEDGFYSSARETARLFTNRDYDAVIAYVETSTYSAEPIFRYFYNEAKAAGELLAELRYASDHRIAVPVERTDNILCVCHASLPDQSGGYAVRAHGILKHLIEHNVEVEAVTRPGFAFSEYSGTAADVVDGVTYLRLAPTGLRREDGEIQYILSFVEPFQRLFREKGAGIIHVRSTYLIALPVLIAARRLGLQVLYEVSGLWDLVYSDNEASSQLYKRSSFAELAEATIMSEADQVVVLNEALQNIAINRGTEPRRISIAHNAVDVQRFHPLDEVETETFNIGYVGSFVGYEGIGRLVAAVKRLSDWGVPVRLIAVGDGTHYSHIKNQVERQQLTESVELPGRVPHADVHYYYRMMDVLVYPRLSTGTTEAITPLKPFEALAMGKPIVVSDVAPLKEIVGDDERGLSFKSGDALDLAQALHRLYTDNELRSKLGAAGRHWVVQNRNWTNVVRVFIKAYDFMRES